MTMHPFRNGPAGKRLSASSAGRFKSTPPPAAVFEEEELRALLPSSTGDEVLLVTETGRIAFANEAFSEALGYDRDELHSMMIMDVDTAMTRAAWLSAFSAMKRVRHAINGETEHTASSGARLRKEYTSACVTIKGKTYFLAIGTAVERIDAVAGSPEEREEQEATMAAIREQTILSAVSDGVMIVDTRGVILEVNSATERHFGVHRAELLGQQCADPRWHFVDARGNALRASTHPLMQALVEEAPVLNSRVARVQNDGAVLMLLVNALPLFDASHELAGAVATLRPAAPDEGDDPENKGTALLGVVGRLTRTLVQATSVDEIERLVCTSLAECGYPLVWFGRLKAKEQRIVPSAWSGPGSDFLLKIKVRYDNTEHGDTSIGRCVREAAEQYVADTQDGDVFQPWKKQAEQENLRSAILLPLFYEGQVSGLLGVFSDERGRFRSGEAAQLRSVAEFVSFAESGVRDRERRRETTQKLALNIPLLDAVFDTAGNAVCVFESRQPFRVLTVNAAFRQLLDEPFKSTGVLDACVSDFHHAFPHAGLYEHLLDCLADGAPRSGSATAFRAWDGSESRWDWSLRPVALEGQPLGIIYTAQPAEQDFVANNAEQDARVAIPMPEPAQPAHDEPGSAKHKARAPKKTVAKKAAVKKTATEETVVKTEAAKITTAEDETLEKPAVKKSAAKKPATRKDGIEPPPDASAKPAAKPRTRRA